MIIFKLLSDLLVLCFYLYLPFKKRKKCPDARDNEIFDFCYKKAIALVYVNPLRNFTEQFSAIRKSFKFDLTIYSGEELKGLLEQAGFRSVKLYGTFDGDPYGLNAQRLIAVGRKPGL